MTNLPELLAPAGSPEAMRAAVAAGADAVYFGGTLFNARMNAKNFSREDISGAVSYCHERGVRVYVTFNTLIYDRELPQALEYAEFLYRAGVDALIITDLGLSALLHEHLPDFPLHASTQLSGHNTDAARFLAERGFTRMVCARELSGESIERLCADSPIEIEAFVHGALCVCHSGQCLLSSMIGGRSGNRGECAQPCRMPYNGGYPLSLKDNCLASHVTKLIASGVSSLKLEGRMKSPEYVYAVVSIYRKLLDERRDATPEELATLAKVFSREGFTDGYFTGRIGKQMLGVRTAEDKAATAAVAAKKTALQRNLPPVEIPAREHTIPKEVYADLKKKLSPIPAKKGENPLSARFYDPASIPDAPAYRGFFGKIYLPLEKFDPKKATGVLLPPVITDKEMPALREALAAAKKAGATDLLVGNVGHLALARESGLALHGDYRFNLTNRCAAAVIGALCEDILLSPELILPQIRDIPGRRGAIVYGRIPVMTLEKPVGQARLKDRTGAEFPLLREGNRDIMFNSVPFYMADQQSKLQSAALDRRHFLFSTEGRREVEYVIDCYRKGLTTKKPVRRIK